MHRNDKLYCFSPTGGTLKVVEVLYEQLKEIEDITVVAAPVYSGRIPALVVDQLNQLNGNGRKAIAVVVYGVRAYDDALLELTDILKSKGFQVIAAGAFIARHSIVPQVGDGRPDEQDIAEIQQFAQQILDKLQNEDVQEVDVPGNRPYRERSKTAATPVSTKECSSCGSCAKKCPTGAIHVEGEVITTDLEKCILCMACVYACPLHARQLPPQMQEGMVQKLGLLKDIRRANETFL